MGYNKLQVASDFGGRQNGGENISGEPLLVQQAHVYFAYKYIVLNGFVLCNPENREVKQPQWHCLKTVMI